MGDVVLVWFVLKKLNVFGKARSQVKPLSIGIGKWIGYKDRI
jgi:hypothetical protein